MRSSTFTDFSAVTTAVPSSAFPLVTSAFETPLTALSAACAFFLQPEAQTIPVNSRLTVFSSAGTTSAAAVGAMTVGAATAPIVKAAKAAIAVNVVFITLSV